MTRRVAIDRLLPLSAVPLANCPEETARGFPLNLGHETAPYEANSARIARDAARGIAYAATGDDLDGDLTVTSGHAHNTPNSLILWRQLTSWRPLSGATHSGLVGLDVNWTTAADFGALDFRLPLDPTGLVAPIYCVYPRIRVSNPTPGSGTTPVLTVSALYQTLSGGVYTTKVTQRPWVLSAVSQVLSDQWVEGPPVRFAQTDLVAAGGDISVLLAASVDTGSATIWEVQIGLQEGP